MKVQVQEQLLFKESCCEILKAYLRNQKKDRLSKSAVCCQSVSINYFISFLLTDQSIKKLHIKHFQISLFIY